MWRSKKFIIIAVLTVVVLGGTLGGVAIASANDDDTPRSKTAALMDKVAEIYEKNTGTPIDSGELQKAFTEARDEIATQAREQFRQKLIDEGKVTQEQLDELEQWLKSRPDFPTDEFKQWMESRPDFPTEEFKQWMESRPDIQLPFGPGNQGGERPSGDMHRGFGDRFGGGFRGWHAPDDTAE
jgi:hypothetical protein